MSNENSEPCSRCDGKLMPGKTSRLYEYGEALLVLREIPALVCSQCGESWFLNDVMSVIEKITNEFKKGHKIIEIARYEDVA